MQVSQMMDNILYKYINKYVMQIELMVTDIDTTTTSVDDLLSQLDIVLDIVYDDNMSSDMMFKFTNVTSNKIRTVQDSYGYAITLSSNPLTLGNNVLNIDATVRSNSDNTPLCNIHFNPIDITQGAIGKLYNIAIIDNATSQSNYLGDIDNVKTYSGITDAISYFASNERWTTERKEEKEQEYNAILERVLTQVTKIIEMLTKRRYIIDDTVDDTIFGYDVACEVAERMTANYLLNNQSRRKGANLNADKVIFSDLKNTSLMDEEIKSLINSIKLKTIRFGK